MEYVSSQFVADIVSHQQDFVSGTQWAGLKVHLEDSDDVNCFAVKAFVVCFILIAYYLWFRAFQL